MCVPILIIVLIQGQHANCRAGATLFEGEESAGPCPVLFSEDPDSSVAALEANPVKAHQDYSKVVHCFFMSKYVKLKEALAVVKKPR
jgi:hypothetical protein